MESSNQFNNQNFQHNQYAEQSFNNSRGQQSPQFQQQTSQSTDVHLNGLKVCFKQAANSLTQLYKQSTFSYNIAYQQGRQDAFDEVVQWFMASQCSSGDSFKNVSKNEFFQFIQEKINKQRLDTAKAHDENQAFIAQLMPPPPNRQPGMPGFMGQTQTSQDLIELAANQSIQEDASNNGGIEVVKKVNLNFGSLKLNDSKKRLKNGQQENQMSDGNQMEMQQISEQSDHNITGYQNNNEDYTRKFYKAKRIKPQQNLLQ